MYNLTETLPIDLFMKFLELFNTIINIIKYTGRRTLTYILSLCGYTTYFLHPPN